MIHPLTPPTRPDGQPIATTMGTDIREWLCKGGLDPDRLAAIPGQPITEEFLVLLWNVRAKPPECGFTIP